MMGNVFLASTFDLLNGYAPDGIVLIIKILMIPGVFFGGFLIKEYFMKHWNHEQYSLIYHEKNSPQKSKKGTGYLLWRQEQITSDSRKRLEKWKKKCKKRRRKYLLIGVLIWFCLTELFPSGKKENRVGDVKENQAVLVMRYNVAGGCAAGPTYLVVIDGKGRWKKTSPYAEELEKVPGWEQCAKEDGVEFTPEFFDAILSSEVIPFQKRRLLISKRNLENAINQCDSPEEYYCTPSIEPFHIRGLFYQITGEAVDDIKLIGKDNHLGEMLFAVEKLPLYFVFWQTQYYVTDINDLMYNTYFQQIVTLLAGVLLTRMVYSVIKKNRVPMRMG